MISVSSFLINFRSFGLYVVALALSGCAGISSLFPNEQDSVYPRAFPNLPSATVEATTFDCPEISGWYKNKGVRVDLDGHQNETVLTRDFFNLDQSFGADDDIHISIEQKPDDEIPVIGLSLHRSRINIASRPGELWQDPDWERSNCYRGYLRILSKPGQVGGIYGWVAISGASTFFRVAADGSLIGKYSAIDSGIIFIVPYRVVSGGAYFRFSKVNSKESNDHQIPSAQK